MLYERNYNVLTKGEIISLEEIEKFKKDNTTCPLGVTPIDVLKKYHEKKPIAAYHYESLFPNNYLFPGNLANKSYLNKIGNEFNDLLRTELSERNILNFINENKYYDLIASLFHAGYTFGHHDAYLFKEFELPSTYKADYLLIGKNSHGYNFLFIELENPTGSITTKDGEFGHTIRKGIKQVRDWNKWLEGNFHTLSLILNKNKNPRKELPNEFRTLNKSRMNYLVIAGRRIDFNENTYDLKRKLMRSEQINLLHYDNLLDSFDHLKSTNNY